MVVDTVYGETGGPEALVQLTVAIMRLNISTYRTTEVSAKYEAEYPLLKSVPILTHESLLAGDILIRPEIYNCDEKLTALGIRQLIWELGDSPPVRTVAAPCQYIGHSFYTALFVGASPFSVIVPYISPSITSIHQQAQKNWTRLLALKKNIVVIDNDFIESVPYINNLSSEFPDFRAVVASGFAPADFVNLLMDAKVVVDGNIRGSERIIYEGAILGAVPLLQNSRNGHFEIDMPFGAVNKFVTFVDMVDRVKEILLTWPVAANTIKENVDDVISTLEASMSRQIQQFLSGWINVVIPVCQPVAFGEALLSGFAWSQFVPLSSVNLVCANGMNCTRVLEAFQKMSPELNSPHITASTVTVDPTICVTKTHDLAAIVDSLGWNASSTIISNHKYLPISPRIILFEAELHRKGQGFTFLHRRHGGWNEVLGSSNSFALYDDISIRYEHLALSCSIPGFRRLAESLNMTQIHSVCQYLKSSNL